MGAEVDEADGLPKFGVDALDALLDGVEGQGAGNAVRAFLTENKTRLATLSEQTVRDFIAAATKGPTPDVAEARFALVDAMTFDEALEFHRLSTETLRDHVNERFRMGAFADDLSRLGGRAAGIAVGLLGKAVGL